MTLAVFILLILSLVCFLIAAFVGHAGGDGTRAWTRTNFVALGLALWVFTLLLVSFPH